MIFARAEARPLRCAKKRRSMASGGRRRPDLKRRQSETVAVQDGAGEMGSEQQCSAEKPRDSC